MEKKIKEKILKQLHKEYDAGQVELGLLSAKMSAIKGIIDAMEKELLNAE